MPKAIREVRKVLRQRNRARALCKELESALVTLWIWYSVSLQQAEAEAHKALTAERDNKAVLQIENEDMRTRKRCPNCERDRREWGA